MRNKNFKPVAGPFGGTDEQATHDAFIEFVGGHNRAEQLSRISKNSYPMPAAYGKQISALDVFRKRAARDGFSQQEIEAFISL